MSVRINLEIGHTASIRNKKTHDGFTHDWEVYVKGSDNAEIHFYVEKVVFHLHETFPRPKRVVREPPYIVKESGYAGFNFPVDIYLRNSGEPKKIQFNYDLQLQQSGPVYLNTQKEHYVFSSINDDFKHKLLKGGGIIVSRHENVERIQTTEEKKELLNKPKLSGAMVKKHKTKPDEPYSFQYFGTPITKTSKVTTEKPVQKDTKVSNNKQEKEKDKSKSKESSNKEKEKDREKKHGEKEKKNRDDKKKDKDRSKERERSKEKSSKRDKSPSPKKSPPKRPPSPPPVVKSREKEDKKPDRKSEEKLDKKPKKDKREHKDNNKHKDKDLKPEHKEHVKKEVAKPTASSPKIEKKEKSKDITDSKDLEPIEKDNSKKSEEKQKHKHKKKDKERKEKKEERKEKKPEKNSLFDSPKHEPKVAKPLNTLISSLADDSSNNSLSSSDNPFPEVEIKKEPPEVKKPKTENKKEKKRSKERKEEEKKRKRKSDQSLEEEPPDKIKIENSEDEGSTEQPVKEEVDNKENKENPEDYMNILRDLQHKIMTLQDNTELQKVVQLIAETGRYEVSARTFDFDLCLLERSTVQQLQEFFASSS